MAQKGAEDPSKMVANGEAMVDAMVAKAGELGHGGLPTVEVPQSEDAKKFQEAIDNGSFDMRGHHTNSNP